MKIQWIVNCNLIRMYVHGKQDSSGGKGVFLRDDVKIIIALTFRSVVSVAYCPVLLFTTTHRDV